MDRLENIESLKNLIMQIRNELSFLNSGRVSSWDAEMLIWFQEQLKEIQKQLDTLRLEICKEVV